MPGGWVGSDRRDRLPANWRELKAAAKRRDPRQVCHWCGNPGGTTLDHIRRGDDHSPDNLAWIHDRQDVQAGRTVRNCHGEKTAAEGNAARKAMRERHRPVKLHPALRD